MCQARGRRPSRSVATSLHSWAQRPGCFGSPDPLRAEHRVITTRSSMSAALTILRARAAKHAALRTAEAFGLGVPPGDDADRARAVPTPPNWRARRRCSCVLAGGRHHRRQTRRTWLCSTGFSRSRPARRRTLERSRRRRSGLGARTSRRTSRAAVLVTDEDALFGRVSVSVGVAADLFVMIVIHDGGRLRRQAE